MLALLQKIYSIVLDLSAKFDRKQLAKKRNFLILVYLLIEHLFCFFNRFTYRSTKRSNSYSNSKDQLILLFADIPTLSFSNIN